MHWVIIAWPDASQEGFHGNCGVLSIFFRWEFQVARVAIPQNQICAYEVGSRAKNRVSCSTASSRALLSVARSTRRGLWPVEARATWAWSAAVRPITISYRSRRCFVYYGVLSNWLRCINSKWPCEQSGMCVRVSVAYRSAELLLISFHNPLIIV